MNTKLKRWNDQCIGQNKNCASHLTDGGLLKKECLNLINVYKEEKHSINMKWNVFLRVYSQVLRE